MWTELIHFTISHLPQTTSPGNSVACVSSDCIPALCLRIKHIIGFASSLLQTLTQQGRRTAARLSQLFAGSRSPTAPINTPQAGSALMRTSDWSRTVDSSHSSCQNDSTAYPMFGNRHGARAWPCGLLECTHTSRSLDCAVDKLDAFERSVECHVQPASSSPNDGNSAAY